MLINVLILSYLERLGVDVMLIKMFTTTQDFYQLDIIELLVLSL